MAVVGRFDPQKRSQLVPLIINELIKLVVDQDFLVVMLLLPGNLDCFALLRLLSVNNRFSTGSRLHFAQGHRRKTVKSSSSCVRVRAWVCHRRGASPTALGPACLFLLEGRAGRFEGRSLERASVRAGFPDGPSLCEDYSSTVARSLSCCLAVLSGDHVGS